ncbi:hypothetical protein CYLTODRAFT_489855 [Cylindrobasidium torrendii FP15055 ss-10]|uniref:Uncharacterized protein n=1 Tax=Cylindrobasidium torrendii FP15055 ss-10 TaxID=1314674 RepID=A0A0D7BCY8_9AGAR|nr:hypothetical protein CYLTODRAFT_489855 [Cylindrobasidium torrendii FP15055 ss-10]
MPNPLEPLADKFRGVLETFHGMGDYIRFSSMHALETVFNEKPQMREHRQRAEAGKTEYSGGMLRTGLDPQHPFERGVLYERGDTSVPAQSMRRRRAATVTGPPLPPRRGTVAESPPQVAPISARSDASDSSDELEYADNASVSSYHTARGDRLTDDARKNV